MKVFLSAAGGPCFISYKKSNTYQSYNYYASNTEGIRVSFRIREGGSLTNVKISNRAPRERVVETIPDEYMDEYD